MKKTILLLGLLIVVALGAVFFAVQNVDWASAQEGVEVPFLAEWTGSGHADATAEAFVHWNEETPAEVPTTCAKCHSTTGYREFHGLDGSTAGSVAKAVPVGEVIACVACHNEAVMEKDSVVMPSGLEIKDLGPEARCMECHQGRESKVSVDASIEKAAVADDDTVSADLGFRNIHYYAAAATKYGTLAKGGYEYDGNTYDGFFAHVDGFMTCNNCHDQHTLELKVEKCAACHEGVTSPEDFKDVRMNGSLVDYDGDGNITEGIYYELEGVREKEFQAVQTYASEVAGTDIAYDPASYPYYFIDANGNGTVDAAETDAYNAWTPRLLKAAYNYQVSVKDPGAFAHGGKYIIELLYDSLADVNTALSKPIDMEGMRRIDYGHFAGSEEAFRHWDEEGEVPADCARCHSGMGLATYLKDGANVSAPLANGRQCANCHNDLAEFTRYEAGPVEFPSGAVVDLEESDSNLCINCHQGRSSTPTVDKVVEGMDANTVSDKLRFQNVHYFAAGATLFGGDVQGAYQYEGKEYFGRNMHDEGVNTCIGCHNAHELTVQVDKCGDCHDGVTTLEDTRTIREYDSDWDGDGNTTEGIAEELDGVSEVLYAAIQDYAKTTAKTPIVYDSARYPYFFADANGNGKVDEGEGAYASFTPALIKATYNYQYSRKDPGAFAHNGQYVIQVMYDSIEDLGGDVSKLTRP